MTKGYGSAGASLTALFPILTFMMCFFGTIWGSSALAQTYDKIGNISVFTQFKCPKGGLRENEKCYTATVTDCTGYDGQGHGFVAQMKVSTPPNPIGVVFFSTGGWSRSWLDDNSADETFDRVQAEDPKNSNITCPYVYRVDGQVKAKTYNCGLQAVKTVYEAGFITVQVNFSNPADKNAEKYGIQTGPSMWGARQTSCRYATLVNGFYNEMLGGAKGFPHPACATGNSHGSSEIAYSITEYGMGRGPGNPPPDEPNLLEFNMVEPTGGPTATRGDLACEPPSRRQVVDVTCQVPPRSVSPTLNLQEAERYVDPAVDGDCDFTDTTYCRGIPEPDSTDTCGESLIGAQLTPLQSYQIIHGAILADDFQHPEYQIPVRIIWGADDSGYVVAQGQLFINAVKANPLSCSVVPNAPHEISSTYLGAMAVAEGLINSCKNEK